MEDIEINPEDLGIMYVDMDGFAPMDPDKPGISILLRSKFTASPVNISDLSDMLLEQNYIGSVLKVIKFHDFEHVNDDEPDNDEIDINETIYAFISIVNITNKIDHDVIQHLIMWLHSKCNNSAPNGTADLLRLVTNPNFNGHLGLFLNERFTNLPMVVSNSLIRTLMDDMNQANAKGMAYKFSHVLIIAKCYLLEDGRVFYFNAEEGEITKFTNHFFQFEIENADPILHTDEDNSVMLGRPYRQVFILDEKGFSDALFAMINFVSVE